MGLSLRDFPVLVILVLLTCALMVVPISYAAALEEWRTARAFFYHGTIIAVVAVLVGIALSNRQWRGAQRYQLVSLLLCFILLPAVMALPVEYLVPSVTFGQAYFEMLSAFTTTGASVFQDPASVPGALHLWRAIVAWSGGFLIILAATSILEPMQLGGFEIQAAIDRDAPRERRSLGGRLGNTERLLHQAWAILPPYMGLTGLLMLGLLSAGDPGLVALCHAMSVISTSAITPLSSFAEAPSGHAGEILVFIFLWAAISRRPTRFLLNRDYRRRITLDPEYNLALICVGSLTLLLFLRHFLAAFEVQEQENVVGAVRAAWGTAFNVLSYLSTTGFDSRDWIDARNWSGLETPGTILLGLCVMGGGIATTAGGVKLLRIYALYKHGVREMQRLIHPNSVGGAGVTARRIRREGANIAWIFLMLFLMGVSVIMLALTATGIRFESALALSIAALTNTGPAAHLFDPGFAYATLGPVERSILCAAMVLGRLEVLVFVSLLNPDYWRR